jgi:hypothetical protein
MRIGRLQPAKRRKVDMQFNHTRSRGFRKAPIRCTVCDVRGGPFIDHDGDSLCIECADGLGPACSQCGRTVQPFIWADGDRCCVRCLTRVPPDGSWLIGALPWDDDDRTWFAAHPNRRLRLRPAFAGELFLAGWFDAAERTAAAERAGMVVGMLVALEAGQFVRRAGDFKGEDLDSYSDAGLMWLATGRGSVSSTATVQ